jgi:K+-transporting ATPase ATPase C chain
MKDLFQLARHSVAGLLTLLLLTVVLGLGYPLAVTGIAAVAMPWQANGSLVDTSGQHTTDPSRAVGSALLGQASDPAALFVPRPSAAGDGYDPLASAGSNLGPDNEDLVATIRERRAAIARREGVDPAAVPADAVTASASGLDPDISPAYAALQVPRVARANGLSEQGVRDLVAEHTDGRTLGVLGEPRVDVLLLNLAVRNATRLG